MAEIVSMPKLGFDMAEGTLVHWVIAEGEPVAKGAILAEIETDKATVEVESPYDGILARQITPEGEIVPVNTPIALVVAQGEEVDMEQLLAEIAPSEELAVSVETTKEEAQEKTIADHQEELETGQLPDGVKASPLARRMASEHKIDLTAIQGSGPGGRIVKKDIQSFLEAPPAKETPVEAPTSKPSAAPIFTPLGPPPADEKIPLNRLRSAIGRRMTESKQKLPHFYVTREYDMAAVMGLRKQINALLPEDEKTSVNDYILKAVALTLREYPNLNASLEGDYILRHGQVNVGVAVAVEDGLLTVVCHDTDRKPVRQIAQEVRDMVARARSGKVRPDDIEGSTFSVSNLGMFGVEDFIAIINPPEAAILAIGAVKEVPVVQDGQIVPGTRMKATISVDHRVSDGAEAAQFLKALANYFEQPLRLVI